MPLDKMKLAKDIKKVLDKMEQKGKKKSFKKSDDPHEFLGKGISKAIDQIYANISRAIATFMTLPFLPRLPRY